MAPNFQPCVPNQAFTLNANGELRGVTYDANGNPTASNGDTDVFDFDPGRLAGASGDSRRLAEGRDERGARTSQNRLIRRTKADGTVIDYVYDANGQRVQKSVMQAFQPALVTGYLIDSQSPSGWPQCVAEVAWTGTDWQSATTYTYGPQGPISQWSANQGDPGRLAGASRDSFWLAEGRDEREARASQHHFLLDAHGNVRALVDANGQVVSAMDYDAHGVPLSVTPAGSPTSSLGYNGEYFDTDLGLIYLRARWYDPSTGRFHTRDPYQGTFEDPMSMQAYLFAHGDPESMIDPSGNFSLVEALHTIAMSGATRLYNAVTKLEKNADPAVKAIGSLGAALNYAASWESLYRHAIPDRRPGSARGSALQWVNQGVALVRSIPYNADLVKHFRGQINENNKKEFAQRMIHFGRWTFRTSTSLLNSSQWRGLVYQKMNGLPEFTPFTMSSKSVVINHGYDGVDRGRGLSGSSSLDEAVAGASSHLTTNGTWHHHEVLGVMQLVPQGLNNFIGKPGVSHVGGIAFWKLMKNTNGKYKR
jgi:RHS repeat-associated protein